MYYSADCTWVNRNFRIKMQRSRSQAAPKINTLIGYGRLCKVLTPAKMESTIKRLKAFKGDSLTIRCRSSFKITFYSK